jgi:hypothetical protein
MFYNTFCLCQNNFTININLKKTCITKTSIIIMTAKQLLRPAFSGVLLTSFLLVFFYFLVDEEQEAEDQGLIKSSEGTEGQNNLRIAF